MLTFTPSQKKKAAVVGQIPTEALENCDSPLSSGRLYSTGTYNITEDFAKCTGSTRVYLNQVSRIDVPLSKKSVLETSDYSG